MFVIALSTSFALVLAIGLSLAIGVAAGYYTIVGLLSILNTNRRHDAGVATARLAVHPGGD